MWFHSQVVTQVVTLGWKNYGLAAQEWIIPNISQRNAVPNTARSYEIMVEGKAQISHRCALLDSSAAPLADNVDDPPLLKEDSTSCA